MFSVAIDGPSGAGKSSVSRCIANELGFIYVDTGALYRSIALYILQNGGDTKSSETVNRMLDMINIKLNFDKGEQFVFLNGVDVSSQIRQHEVSTAAANVSSMKQTRDFLFDLQREMVKYNNIVMDGRDIGTVVLPYADVKIYLTASVQQRALRRFKQLNDNSITCEQVFEDVQKRDNLDMSRELSPLKKAVDAIEIDTTHLTFDETVQNILKIIRGKMEAIR